MKNLTIKFLLTATLFAIPALAGGNHNHGHSHEQKAISSEKVSVKAIEKVKQLVKTNKIDISWDGIKPSNTQKKVFNHDPEWVITFKNNKISNVKKQNLYLFYSLSGKYIAANYTGN